MWVSKPFLIMTVWGLETRVFTGQHQNNAGCYSQLPGSALCDMGIIMVCRHSLCVYPLSMWHRHTLETALSSYHNLQILLLEVCMTNLIMQLLDSSIVVNWSQYLSIHAVTIDGLCKWPVTHDEWVLLHMMATGVCTATKMIFTRRPTATDIVVTWLGSEWAGPSVRCIVYCVYRLLAQSKIRVQNCRTPCDLNPPIEAKISRDYTVLGFYWWDSS